jgi:hypothetical protein
VHLLHIHQDSSDGGSAQYSNTICVNILELNERHTVEILLLSFTISEKFLEGYKLNLTKRYYTCPFLFVYSSGQCLRFEFLMVVNMSVVVVVVVVIVVFWVVMPCECM